MSVNFELNDDAEIVKAAGRHYYDIPDGFVEADWHYQFSEHHEFGDMHVPVFAVATYHKPDGAWEYWRGRITSLVVES